MKDYSKMSDFEVNKAVIAFSCAYADVDIVQHPHHVDGVSVGLYRACGDYYEWFDYCNNPSDAWPLIESNLICLMADVFCEPQDGGKWIAQPAYGWQHERVRNDNPLRAAMIVYLMMKDGEK